MKRVRAVLPFLLFIVLMSTVTAGCWDRRELEERTSVVAMSIDRVDEKEQSLVKLSVQIPIPIKIVGSGGGGGEGGKSAVKVMSATGYSMADAMRNLQQRLNQQLFYGHTRVVAISEAVAREDLSAIVDSLRRSPQMRRLLWMVITPQEAVKLLEADPKLEQIPIVYVMDLMENGSKSGIVPDITLGRWFIDRSSSGSDAMANYIQSTPREVKWHGLALFNDDKMVGHLEEDLSWVLMQVKNKQIGGDVTISCPQNASQGGGVGSYLTAHPKKVHVKTTVAPYQNTFKMTVDVMVEDDIVESMCNADFSKEESYRLVEKALAAEMNSRAQKMVEKVQGEYGVDVFGMGNKVRANYMKQFEQLDWKKEFPKTKIEVRYTVEVRRVGMKMQ